MHSTIDLKLKSSIKSIGCSFNWRLISLGFLVTLMTGCASQSPEISQKVNWPTQEQQLSKLTHYQASGKLAYKDNQQRFGANLNWQTNNQNDHLLLTNFLGQTLIKLDTTPKSVTLIDYKGNEYHGTNAAELVSRLTGINLPIEQMQNWLIGLPTAADTFQLNDQGVVGYLAKQIGPQLWEMHYQEYDFSQHPALPSKMILSQGKQKITLVINEWNLK
ncbi:TPA: lipoprotein insertase outer membrane protein LolB [Photobacterium damselae]